MTKKGEIVRPKRGVVICDLHCGHMVGLTHPDFNPTYSSEAKNVFSRERAKYYRFFSETIAALQPIDLLIVDGDAIDGRGEKSGGTELLTNKRDEQCEMAVAAIKECNAEKIWLAYGTGYHTGKEEDWEEKIAKEVSAFKIGGEDSFTINGLTICAKHHLGRSESPTGRFTALARDRVWNVLWSEWDEYPKADVIIRAHVHYFGFCGGHGWLGITCPALQGYGTKFGSRRMSGTVDFGLVSFDITDKEHFTWQPHIYKQNTKRANTIEI